MVGRHICSAILLALVSANMMQGAVILPSRFYNQGVFPNFLSYPGVVGSFPGNAVASAASAASSTSGLRSYLGNYRTLLGGNLVSPARYGLLNRYVNGEGLWPYLANPAYLDGTDAIVTGIGGGNLVGPGLLGGSPYVGNYGVEGFGGETASAAAASSAAAGSV